MSTSFLVLAFIGFYCTSCVIAADGPKQHQCYTCRGINCLRTTKQEVNETCLNNLDVCVTIFDKFTVAARGCLLNMPAELRDKCNDKTNPECHICSEVLCNDLGRIDYKCYECNEMNNLDCARNVTSLVPVQCKIPSAPNSYCFSKIIDSRFIRRGCSLHVKDQKACLASSDCTLCSVAFGQGCNTAELKPQITAGVEGQTAFMAIVLLCALVARMAL